MTEEQRKEYNEKIRSELFGLLCEYEKDRNWERFLDSILVELLNIEEDRKNGKEQNAQEFIENHKENDKEPKKNS